MAKYDKHNDRNGMTAMKSPVSGSVPNPDPTARTIETLQRDIGASREIVEASNLGTREVLETRLDGMDKAIKLLQETTDRIPQFIKESIRQLEALHDEKFTSIDEQISIQFAGIATQFQERDKRTEQLSLADKTAIAAALQAQKEAAGAQNESNTAAITKMETNFIKLIDQGQNLLQAMAKGFDDKINDVKSRLDKGEGTNAGYGTSWGVFLGLGGFILALVTFATVMFKLLP